MSNQDSARRVSAQVLFQGVDITKDIRPYFLSATYTDNEEDETDDLQIVLQDRDKIWLQKWLHDVLDAAGETPQAAAGSSAPDGGWKVGDAVIANGRGYYSSYGALPQSIELKDHAGKVTYTNPKAPYPVAVDQIGWFAESQLRSPDGGGAVVDADAAGFSIQALFVQENWSGGGKDSLLDCGEFELDAVDVSGPPNTITIKATSLPYTAQIRQTEKSKAWEAYTLSGIAKEMAKTNGMTCMYLAAADPAYKRVEQFKTSDISFLSGLCHKAGISLKATSRLLVLFDQAEYEAKASVLKLQNGSGAYLKYKLGVGQAETQYASCRVSYADPGTGKCIEGIAKVEDYDAKTKNNQQLEISEKVADVGEAKALAEKMLRLHNKYAKTASFTLPGNSGLAAGQTVTLSGWGPWDGKYIISQAKHSIAASGYTTQIKLRRVLEGY